ncbi:MAG TPA: hypothetical protein VGI31_00990 [Streptosporangiaceae bacterium]|jgi:hypothetical protein
MRRDVRWLATAAAAASLALAVPAAAAAGTHHASPVTVVTSAGQDSNAAPITINP